MTDTYRTVTAAFRRALPAWVGIPGYGGGVGAWATQANASELMGISQATASRIIAGRADVTLAQLAHVAELRRVSLAQLVAELEPWGAGGKPCRDCDASGTLHGELGTRRDPDDVCPTCRGAGALGVDDGRS